MTGTLNIYEDDDEHMFITILYPIVGISGQQAI
jgi:hypothetical protein